MNTLFAITTPTQLDAGLSAIFAALGVFWLLIVVLLAFTWFAWLILPFILWHKFNQIIAEMKAMNITLGWLGETAVRARVHPPVVGK
jgi:hypothetical protein